jgi:hypothetical protein
VPSRVATAENLFDYFRLRVEEARAADRADVSDEASLYLVQLLTDRARTDRAAPEADTLAELHALAAHARPAEQARTYRELGDRALYGLGYFREHLEGRVVSLDYYERMGRAAYDRVDHVLKHWFADAFGPVFHELAGRFRTCVEVLSSVRRAHDGEDDLERLYREWLATGSEEAAAALRRRGLVLVARVPSDPPQDS